MPAALILIIIALTGCASPARGPATLEAATDYLKAAHR